MSSCRPCRQVNATGYLKEVERYNECLRQSEFYGERTFFAEVTRKYPEFDALYRKQPRDQAGRRGRT